MRPPVQTPRPPRRSPSVLARTCPIAALRVVNTPRVELEAGIAGFVPATPGASRGDPYLDYGRTLTPEGGVLIVYKDLDLRWRHTLWRLLAWSLSTGYAGWQLRDASPVHATWLNIVCFLTITILNWLIVAKPVEVYRRLEIRPDCLILEGVEVFWRERMEGGMPTLQPDEDGTLVLCGVYGTRFVEYGRLRRFDEFDRMPEVFAGHLAEAVGQLWNPLS